MSGSGSNDGVSGLNALIHHSLHPYTAELHNISPETQQHLLLSLSQIISRIKHCNIQPHTAGSNFQEHHFLTDTFSILISLLNADNKFIQYSVGNLFLVLVEYLQACGSNLEDFICLLCTSFELGLCNVFGHHSQPPSEFAKNPNLNLIVNNLSWDCVAGILRVLRGILKLSKGEDDTGLAVILMNSLSASLSKVPWDLLKDVQNSSSTDVKICYRQEKFSLLKDGNTEGKTLIMGSLVALLCSLVGLSCTSEDSCGFISNSSILHKTCELLPEILHWCFDEEMGSINGRVLTYLRHKFLMLMIRLSFHMQLDLSTLLLWAQLLHKYFQDLLCRPLADLHSDCDDSLEGSPFISSLDDHAVCHLSSRHLQRQAIFLFARCCLTLAGSKEHADLNIPHKRASPLLECYTNTAEVCFARKKGILEFNRWLQVQLPSDMCSKNQFSLENCVKFATSFIRLYVHEDDMLFGVLLQMLSVPSLPENSYSKNGRAFCDADEDIFVQVYNLFNPLLLFHVFLSELQYDHQLLLDYLISKDTGSKCAEYLLRCLRIVCDSWSLFVQLLVKETSDHLCFSEKSCKRMRMVLVHSGEEQVATPVLCGHTESSDESQEKCEPRSKFFGNSRTFFVDAKVCLLSLKCALRKLHKKKLFPYNPEVLIRRITRFEGLCDQHV